MKIGINVTNFKPDLDVAVVARRVEELGFESFWMPEHILYPVKVASRYYGTADGADIVAMFATRLRCRDDCADADCCQHLAQVFVTLLEHGLTCQNLLDRPTAAR